MKNLFTIGEIAELFGVNIRTLRYYDEIGLLRPEITDPENGYRYYSTKQFERLNSIRYLRALGVSLKKISLFFESRDVNVLRQLLREQMNDTDAQIEQLFRIRRKLQCRLDCLEDAMDSDIGVIRLQTFPKRPISFLRREIFLGDDLEYPIRELEKSNSFLEASIFLGKVGLSIARERLLADQFDAFSSIFVLLEEGDTGKENTDVLAAGDYLTVRLRGIHQDAAPFYQKLFEYMKEHRLSCIGDSVEITLIDSGFTNDTEQYVTELQIPVAPRS